MAAGVGDDVYGDDPTVNDSSALPPTAGKRPLSSCRPALRTTLVALLPATASAAKIYWPAGRRA